MTSSLLFLGSGGVGRGDHGIYHSLLAKGRSVIIVFQVAPLPYFPLEVGRTMTIPHFEKKGRGEHDLFPSLLWKWRSRKG